MKKSMIIFLSAIVGIFFTIAVLFLFGINSIVPSGVNLNSGILSILGYGLAVLFVGVFMIGLLKYINDSSLYSGGENEK